MKENVHFHETGKLWQGDKEILENTDQGSERIIKEM